MRHFDDYEMKSRVWICNGPSEIAQTVAKWGETTTQRVHDNNWAGRTMERWQDLPELFNSPWPEGMAEFEKVHNEIKKDVTEPVSVKRAHVWSETDGDIDVDRALRGEQEYMRTTKRKGRLAPRTIILLACVGGMANMDCRQMTLRGATVVAVMDLLEMAGYSVECWAWSRARNSFYDKTFPDAFTGYKIKEAGQEMNVESIVKSLSGWFFRHGVLGLRHTGKNVDHGGLGQTHPIMTDRLKSFMDIDLSVQSIVMPWTDNHRAAVDAGKKIMQEVEDYQSL